MKSVRVVFGDIHGDELHTCFTKTNTWIVLSMYLKVKLLITQNVRHIEREWAVQ